MVSGYSDTICHDGHCDIYENSVCLESIAVRAVSYHTCAGAKSMVEVLFRVGKIVIYRCGFKEKLSLQENKYDKR